MKLEKLEEVERVVRFCQFMGVTTTKESLRRSTLSISEVDAVLQLIADEQFYVLLDLKRAERHAFNALGRLVPATEYLRHELERHLLSLQVLLEKVEAEEALRRDRAALLSTLPPPDPDQGVASWITGRTSDPDSSS